MTEINTEPVGSTATTGPSKSTQFKRLAKTQMGLALLPSRYPIYIGLIMLTAYAFFGVLLRNPIRQFIHNSVAGTPLFGYIMVCGLALALLLSALGPVVAYFVIKRVSLSSHFIPSQDSILLVDWKNSKTIQMSELQALQLCNADLGNNHHTVIAYELNLVLRDSSETIRRECILCGGPKAYVAGIAQRIASELSCPVMDSTNT